MKVSLYQILFLLLCSNFCISQNRGDQIFDETQIHEIRITSELDVNELFDVFLNDLNGGEFSYTMADVAIDGNILDSIGVRVKGGLSAFDTKKPLKLDFNVFVSGKKYDGLKKLNLHQGNLDPSFMREAVTYNIIRNTGVKTVRTSFAKVYVNDIYEGIYTLIEQIDDNFIHNRFASNDGALYKTGPLGLSLKYEKDNSLPYSEFEDIINQIPTDQLHESLHEYLDVESFLRFFATEVFVNAVDGPLTVNENYYIYYEPKSAKYVYIPWDYNLALYGGANHTIFPLSANFIFNKMKNNATLREQYLDIFCQQLQYNFDENRIQNLILSYQTLLNDEVPNDPYINQIGNWESGVSNLQNVVSNRVSAITEEMTSISGQCNPLTNPISSMDIVINEIVASNDSTSSITDLAGGSADWVELYNNTDSDISLDGFYLSNDADVLKHWRFPKDQIIGANDYLIVWADRDIQEEGLHTDFKLTKSSGELYLSFENGEVIDFVFYEDQNTNIGLARIPNGTGAFIQQATTFNSSNETLISVNDLHIDQTFSVFPNPIYTNQTLNLKSSKASLSNLQLIDIQGAVLWQSNMNLIKGMNKVEMPLIRSGIFNLSLTDVLSGETSSRRIIVIR